MNEKDFNNYINEQLKDTELELQAQKVEALCKATAPGLAGAVKFLYDAMIKKGFSESQAWEFSSKYFLQHS